MKNRLINLLGILVLIVGLQACGAQPAPAGQPVATEPATQPAAPGVVTEPPTQAPVVPVSPTTGTIVHLTTPPSPSYIGSQTAEDCSEAEGYVAGKPFVISTHCNNAEANLVERPFSSDWNVYAPYLDIARAQFGTNTNPAWFFSRLVLFDPTLTPENIAAGDIYYFFVVDTSMKSGDPNLVIYSVKNLPTTAVNWTTDGVQAWTFSTGNLTKIFDQGVGTDPDAFWVRRAGQTVEFGVKSAFLYDPIQFGWAGWAYQGTLTPPDIAITIPGSDVFNLDVTCVIGYNAGLDWLPNACR